MHDPLVLMASAAQIAEAGKPTTNLDWALIAITGTVIGGLVLTTKRVNALYGLRERYRRFFSFDRK